MRKLALGLALALALPSSGVLALGLGEIDTQSALNQKLTAAIELLSVRPGELDGLVVGLADRRAFERAGIERPFYLTKLRFSVKEDADGRAFIQISSLQPVREPFLDFLVEVNWANGRILREYTVLLDPPTMMAGRAAQVQAPAAKELTSSPAVTSPAPTTASPSSGAAVRPVTSAPSTSTGYAGDSYGPVRGGETLWNIARRVRADSSVSVEQMMLALLRSNPEAFIGQNINRMRSGFVLRVPDQSEVLSVTSSQALAEVKRQTALWRDYRNRIAGGKPTAVTAQKTPAAGAASAPTTTTAAQTSDATPSDAKLRLVAPGEQTGGEQATQANAQASTVVKLRQELNLVTEAAEVQRKENEELRDRVSVLEDQINTMQRMFLTLQDQDLSALQQRLQAEQQTSVDPAVAATQTQQMDTAPPSADTSVDASVDESGMGESGMGESGMGESGVGTEMTQVDESPEVAETTPPTAVEKTPSEQTPPPAVTPAPQVESVPSTQSEPSFVQRLMQDPLTLLLGGGGILLALLLFFVARRSRRKAEQAFPESILQDNQVANDFETASEDITSPAEDTSFLDDLAVSDMSSIHTDVGEADPLAEADVFLAYGRYQQAEELIKDAIDMHPERNDLKLKLLEIYHAGHNVDAFQTQAEVLYAALGGQADPLWDRAVALGRELCPDAPLFNGDMGETSMDLDAEPFPDPDLSVAADAESEVSVGEISEKDLEDLWSQTPDAQANPEDGSQDETTELSTQAFRDAQPEADPVHIQPGEAGADSGLDFDLNVDFASEEVPPKAPEPSLDLSGFDGGSELSNDANKGASEDLSVDFDLGNNPLDETVGDYSDAEELNESDEVTTKLDLAKAYIEMGDAEGARSILDEVLEEGSDSQKAQAHELLQQVE